MLAKVFKSGNSQAVRLPKAMRFDVNEVEYKYKYWCPKYNYSSKLSLSIGGVSSLSKPLKASCNSPKA
jgi:hypothetical protein